MTRYSLTSDDGAFEVEVQPTPEGYRVTVGDSTFLLRLARRAGRGDDFVVEMANRPMGVRVLEASSQRVEIILEGERLSYNRPTAAIGAAVPATTSLPLAKNLITAPMPGKVVGMLVKKGDRVKAGDPLIILESMKMEMAVRSDRDAEVSEVLVEEGASVRRGEPLARLED